MCGDENGQASRAKPDGHAGVAWVSHHEANFSAQQGIRGAPRADRGHHQAASCRPAQRSFLTDSRTMLTTGVSPMFAGRSVTAVTGLCGIGDCAVFHPPCVLNRNPIAV